MWFPTWPLQICRSLDPASGPFGSQQVNRIPSGNLYHSYGKITFSLYIARSWSISRLNHRRVSLGLENNLPICFTQRVSQRNESSCLDMWVSTGVSSAAPPATWSRPKMGWMMMHGECKRDHQVTQVKNQWINNKYMIFFGGGKP